MKLSVIIPCFNEINTIEQIISKVQNFNDLEKEIIVIDDCSNDGTKEKLNSEISNAIDKLITNDKIHWNWIAIAGVGPLCNLAQGTRNWFWPRK